MDLRFQARGLQVHRTMQNLVCRDDAGQYRAQVDLLVVNGDTAIPSPPPPSVVLAVGAHPPAMG